MTNTTAISGNEGSKSNRTVTLDHYEMERLWRECIFRMKDIYLIPFYFFVSLYYILYQPYWNYPPVTFTAALFKVLPVWSLVLYIKLTSGSVKELSANNFQKLIKEFFKISDYSKFIMAGLIMSSLGDALLVSRGTLFVPGMVAFAVAHAFYLYAMGSGNYESRLTDLFILGAIDVYLFLASDIDSVFMQIIVLIYVVLIFSVGWKSATRFEKDRNVASMTSAIGMLLFVFSDFIIAVDKWKFSLPFCQCIVMASYYASQFFLALSTKSA